MRRSGGQSGSDSEHGQPPRPYRALHGRKIPGRVIFVGQIIPEKGVDLLLDALAMVRGRGVDATLDVVGDMDGWEAPAYRVIARHCGNARRDGILQARCNFLAGAKTCRRC